MRPREAIVGWSAVTLIGGAPLIYVAWIVHLDGGMLHPLDIGAAFGPWMCLAMAMLGGALALARLINRRTGSVAEAALWIAVTAVIFETPVFFLTMVGFATGIGAPP